jgi:hypothetical protein
MNLNGALPFVSYTYEARLLKIWALHLFFIFTHNEEQITLDVKYIFIVFELLQNFHCFFTHIWDTEIRTMLFN